MLTVSTASNASKFVYFSIVWSIDSKDWFGGVLAVLPVGFSESLSYGSKPEVGIPDEFNNKPCQHFNVRGNLLFINSGTISRRITRPINYINVNGFNTWYDRIEFFVTGKPTYWAPMTSVWGSSQTLITPMFKRTSVSDPYTVLTRTVRFVREDIVYASTVMYSRKTPGGAVTKVQHLHSIWKMNSLYKKLSQYSAFTNSEDLLDPDSLTFSSPQTMTPYALGSTATELHALPTISRLRDRFELARIHQSTPDFVKFGDLVQTAADNTRALEINTPMYLRDLLQTISLAKQLVRLASSDVSVKVLSAAYLVAHYGLKLTYSDTKAISKALEEAHDMDVSLPFQVARARASEDVMVHVGFRIPVIARIEHNVKLYYDPVHDGIRGLWHQLHSWDVLPTIANLWDIIPFSFVVDWFVDCGAVFESWDTKDYMCVMRIQSTIATKRTSICIPAEDFFGRTEQGYFIGNVELIDYNRQVLKIPPQPISRFDVPRSFTHWVEGAAIIVQKL